MGAYKNKNYAKKSKSPIATTIRACVIAPKIQVFIPLVFPLKIKGEMTWLLPPLFIRKGRGGIGFKILQWFDLIRF
jgi:hypothetical protein